MREYGALGKRPTGTRLDTFDLEFHYADEFSTDNIGMDFIDGKLISKELADDIIAYIAAAIYNAWGL